MLINGAAGADALGSPNSVGAGGTVVVVDGDIISNSADLKRVHFVLVNGTESSLGTPCDGIATMGDNGTVCGAEPSSTSIGEIIVLLFVLSMFYIRDGESVLETLKKGGINGNVVVVVLLVSRVIKVSGLFGMVVVVILTWNAAALVAVASGALSKSVT